MPNGAPTVDGLSIETAEADEPADEEEEDDEFTSTSEAMTSTADPEQFDRTFLAKKENWRLAGPFASPAPFPLQVIPRMAYVINYSYIFNEDQQQWEPQKKGDLAPGLVSKLTQTAGNSQSIPGGEQTTVVDWSDNPIDTLGGGSVGDDSVTIQNDGIHFLASHVRLGSAEDQMDFDLNIRADGNTVAATSDQASGTAEVSSGTSTVVDLEEDDTIDVTVRQDGANAHSTDPDSNVTRFTVARI